MFYWSLDVPVDIHFLLDVIAPTSLSSKLESGESMMTYNPQRKLRQFGYDQGATWMAGGNCVKVWEVKISYVRDGRDCLLGTLPSIF